MAQEAANYVKLVEGIEKRVKFEDHVWKDVPKRDSITGWVQPWHTLIMRVIEEDGEKVDKTMSVPQEKLQKILIPYLEGQLYRYKTFVITQHGRGFVTEFEVEIR
jgi:hypothetical protein